MHFNRRYTPTLGDTRPVGVIYGVAQCSECVRMLDSYRGPVIALPPTDISE